MAQHEYDHEGKDNLTVVAAIKDFSEFPEEQGDVKSLMKQTERAVQITGRVQQEIVLPFKQERKTLRVLWFRKQFSEPRLRLRRAAASDPRVSATSNAHPARL